MTKKKKKLKHPGQRMPKVRTNFTDLSTEVSNRTGYRTSDVRDVLKTSFEIIIENLKDNKTVMLPLMGMFYPFIRTARPGVSLKGGVGKPELITVPPRWQAKFKPGNYLLEELAKKDPTPEEIENLYED